MLERWVRAAASTKLDKIGLRPDDLLARDPRSNHPEPVGRTPTMLVDWFLEAVGG
jgi:hypothetical protein